MRASDSQPVEAVSRNAVFDGPKMVTLLASDGESGINTNAPLLRYGYRDSAGDGKGTLAVSVDGFSAAKADPDVIEVVRSRGSRHTKADIGRDEAVRAATSIVENKGRRGTRKAGSTQAD